MFSTILLFIPAGSQSHCHQCKQDRCYNRYADIYQSLGPIADHCHGNGKYHRIFFAFTDKTGKYSHKQADVCDHSHNTDRYQILKILIVDAVEFFIIASYHFIKISLNCYDTKGIWPISKQFVKDGEFLVNTYCQMPDIASVCSPVIIK